MYKINKTPDSTPLEAEHTCQIFWNIVGAKWLVIEDSKKIFFFLEFYQVFLMLMFKSKQINIVINILQEKKSKKGNNLTR